MTPRGRTSVGHKGKDLNITIHKGEKVEVLTCFLFLGSKTTADGDCSHEIRRRLLLGRKGTTDLNSVLKSRGVTLTTNVHIIKAVVFPMVTYGCES